MHKTYTNTRALNDRKSREEINKRRKNKRRRNREDRTRERKKKRRDHGEECAFIVVRGHFGCQCWREYMKKGIRGREREGGEQADRKKE